MEASSQLEFALPYSLYEELSDKAISGIPACDQVN
jgi:hypothetical protein